MIHVTDIIPPIGTPPDSWPQYSWLAVWGQLIPQPCDLEPGGEVILVDPSGVATWRTEVTDMAIYPFEHVQSGLDELRRRWRIDPIYVGPVTAPGVLVAWQARPVGYLGAAVPDVSSLPAIVCERCADDELSTWIRQLPRLLTSAAGNQEVVGEIAKSDDVGGT